MHDQRAHIGDDDPHQDRDDAEHSLPPDVKHDDGDQSYKRQEPVGLSVVDGGTGKRQADADDDGPGHNRRQETHDTLHAYQPDDERKDQIQKSGNHDAAAGVGRFLICPHCLVDTALQSGDRRKTAEKSE